MDFQRERGRIYLPDEAGHTTAEVTFCQRPDGRMCIDHTYVAPTLRDQGIAGKLVKAAADHFRTEGRKVVPVCSYAAEWFRAHPEEQDLLR